MNEKAGTSKVSTPTVVGGREAWFYLAPTALLLLVLPIAHTTALRMLFLAGTAIAAVWFWRRSAAPKVPLLPAFSLCAVVAFASLITAADPVFSFDEIKKELGYGVITFAAFFSLSRGPREMRVWICTLLASLLLLLAYVLWADATRGTLNFDGLHGGVLSYSVFITTTFPLLLGGLAHPGVGKYWKYAILALIPAVLFSGYLTENRMFWFAIVGSLLVFAGMYVKLSPARNLRAPLLAGVLAIVTVSAIGFALTAATRLNSNEDLASTLVATVKTDPRMMLWHYGVQRIREHPLMGTGFGRMQQAHEFRQRFDNTLEFVHAHNMFLNYGVQMGIPGIAAYLFLFICVIREFARLYRSPDTRVALIGIAGISIVVAVLLKSTTDDQFIRHNALLFWALVGMGLGYGARLAGKAGKR